MDRHNIGDVSSDVGSAFNFTITLYINPTSLYLRAGRPESFYDMVSHKGRNALESRCTKRLLVSIC